MRQVGDRLIPVGVTSSRTQLPEGITTVEVSLSSPSSLAVLTQFSLGHRGGLSYLYSTHNLVLTFVLVDAHGGHAIITN